VGDAEQPVRVIEPAVQDVELGGDAVEPFEQRVELAVVEGLARLGHGFRF
jgi:hypothetical protein